MILDEKYVNFSAIYESIIRGNEIEFRYKDKSYYIVPFFECNSVRGICFGEKYSGKEVISESEGEAYNILIGDSVLGKEILKCDIEWINF